MEEGLPATERLPSLPFRGANEEGHCFSSFQHLDFSPSMMVFSEEGSCPISGRGSEELHGGALSKGGDFAANVN